MHIIGEGRMTSKLKVRIDRFNTIPETYEIRLTACLYPLALIWPMALEDIAELRDKLSEFLLSKGYTHDLGETLPEILKQQAE